MIIIIIKFNRWSKIELITFFHANTHKTLVYTFFRDLFYPPSNTRNDDDYVIDDYYFPNTGGGPSPWPGFFSSSKRKGVRSGAERERAVSTRDSANLEPASRWINTPSSNCGVTIEGARKKPFPARSTLPRYHPLKTRRYARRYHADDSELESRSHSSPSSSRPRVPSLSSRKRNERLWFEARPR